MTELPIDQLWRFALAAIPVAAAAALLCRLFPCRPSTRHAILVTVLGLLILAPFLPQITPPALETVIGMASTGTEADTVTDAGTVTDAVTDTVTDTDAALPSARPRHPVVTIPTAPTIPTARSTIPTTGAVAPIPGAVVLAQPRPRPPATDTHPRTTPPPAEIATVGLWVARLRDVRDAVMTLPPIPTTVWGGGAVLVIIMLVGRVIVFRRLLATATAADPATVRLVSDGAASLNLTRAPVTRFVEEHISPLVWCGAQPCLILPRGLWSRLDDTGRRAVVLHELAHLRRRDHWVCWLAAIVGCLYWWHPVVWWLRRRIREEADLCCDAWVTTLLPDARRAYATALLETKKYTSVQPSTEFAVGLGVSTVRARRFSRRLTMVMSKQIAPRLTIGGILLASVLAVGGWLAAPALACPPADAKTAKVPKARTFYKLEKAKPRTAPAADDTSTFERFMRNRPPAGEPDASLQERLERIEKLMDKLRQNLGTGGLSRIIKEGGAIDTNALGAYIGKQRSLVTDAQSAYRAALSAIGSARGVPDVTTVTVGTADCDQQVTRSYTLSKRKLDALTELMVRSDVPIYVTPHDDRIDVHATPPQHMVFRVFVDMIDGDKGEHDFTVADGKREALTALMIDSDVPTKIRPSDDGITIVGSALEQRIFGAFVDMISGKTNAPRAVGWTTAPKIAEAVTAAQAAGSIAGNHQIATRRAEFESLRANLHTLERLMRQRERRAEDLMEQAERVADEAERIEDEADRLEDECDEAEGQTRLRAVQRLNQLLLNVRQLENQCRYLEAQAHAVEVENESTEEQAEALETRMERIEQLIEELMEKREQTRKTRRTPGGGGTAR